MKIFKTMYSILFLLISISYSSNLIAKKIVLSKEQAQFVADKVWQNEGAGKDKYLVHWNDGEDFASVGIGHFIWFSKGHTEKFKEMFPEVLKFMESKNVLMPDWLNSTTALPWNSKSEFYQAKQENTKKYLELFNFLKNTKAVQAEFLAFRLNQALPKILKTIHSKEKKTNIEHQFNAILFKLDGSVSERGLYALLDYINFKGEGIVKSERYKGEGWGLLQVLEHMNSETPNILQAFAESADERLKLRIRNSPPKRGEQRWASNWHNRVMGYYKYETE